MVDVPNSTHEVWGKFWTHTHFQRCGGTLSLHFSFCFNVRTHVWQKKQQHSFHCRIATNATTYTMQVEKTLGKGTTRVGEVLHVGVEVLVIRFMRAHLCTYPAGFYYSRIRDHTKVVNINFG